MKRNPIQFSALVLMLSVLSAYVCAAAYIIVLQLSLPPTDLAYGQSLSQTFSDPFVRSIAATGATGVGLLAFPVALFCLWHRDLMRGGLFVVGITLVYIVAGTFLAPPIGLFGCPLVALVALLFCRFTRFSFFRPHDYTTNVA